MSAFLKRVEFGLQTNYRTNDTNLSLIKFELRILKAKQRKKPVNEILKTHSCLVVEMVKS